MLFFGFDYSIGFWNPDTGKHAFSTSSFKLKHIIAVSNQEFDGCNVDRIEFDPKDKNLFYVHLNFICKDICERLKYRFYLIYSTGDGKLYRQKIDYDRKTTIWMPEEILLD